MRKQLLASAAVLAISGGAAFAADLPTHKSPLAPAPAAAFTWTGCYAGLHAGGDFGTSSGHDEYGVSLSGNTSGAIGGAQVGCNYQVDHFVIGAEAEIWGSGLTGSASKAISDGEGYVTEHYKARSDVAGDIALRAGYAIDRTLIFGKVGLAVAQYHYSVSIPDDEFYASSNSTYTGLLLGLGVEYALDAHWSVKGEYDYITYPSKNVTFSDSGTFIATSIKNQENIVKVGVNYRF